MIRFLGKKKMDFKSTELIKIILHVCLNLGPKGKANEDIEEHLKESPSKKDIKGSNKSLETTEKKKEEKTEQKLDEKDAEEVKDQPQQPEVALPVEEVKEEPVEENKADD